MTIKLDVRDSKTKYTWVVCDSKNIMVSYCIRQLYFAYTYSQRDS